MDKLENGQYTFWKLLQKVGIKIPIIQRDYAQGRKNKQVENIRDSFVAKLFSVLTTDKTIDLDFVYGTIENEYLIPLDGQQRLTTLFLLHYYLALKDKKLDENKKILQKFTYETRLSSREFTALLIEKSVNLKDNKNISIMIKNQTWFFSEWENDPTIKGMLVMLDAIQEKFKNTDKGLFDKLISEEKKQITFSFLNLDEFKLTDELYIKMNARGKPLTEFENFKSRFENFIKDSIYKAKLDNDWYDLFWKMSIERIEKNKEDTNPVEKADELFLNFFKNITAFYSEDFNEVDIFKFDYKNSVQEISKTLDCLESYNNEIIYELRDFDDFKIKIFENFLDDKITYEQRLRFYALMKFFEQIGKITQDNEKLFKQWMRVSINIVQNSIYNDIKDFKRYKELLDHLINLLDNNFYNQLSNSDLSKTYQFNEEKLKADLILSDSVWENEFIKAEKNWYLDGQIGFLLDYSIENGEYNLEKFKKYRDKFIALWNFAQENKDNQILLYQALLTKGNYLPKLNSNYTFCSFDGTSVRVKNDNWRKVFYDHIKSEYFKQLLDDIDKNIIQKSLENIIQKWLQDKAYCNLESFQDKFLFALISNKENIKYCQNLQLRYYQDGKEAYLLKKNQMNGTHAELYTYDLYIKYLKNQTIESFDTIEYFYTNSWNLPCVVLDDWSYGKYKYKINIYFNADTEKYEIYFIESNERQITNEIVNILGNNFKKEKEYQYLYETDYTLCKENDLISFIKNLTKNLTNLML